ncbi:MAG TPA: MFS transporter [Draconibacterium sp.]|nr:MFS transporter [Draconibacterium sp.]
MKPLLKDRQYYKFSLYGFLKNMRFFDAFFILFLVEKGLPYTQIGILYAVREIVINILEVPSGFAADTYGRKNALLGSFLAYIVSFIIFYLSGNFALFLLAFVFFGIGDAFRTGTHKAMIMDYLKLKGIEDSKISYYGHTRSWSQMGSALSTLIAGVLVFYTGNYTNVFLYSVIPYLLNFGLIASYPRQLNYSSENLKEVAHFNLAETFKSFFTVIRYKNVIRIINTTSVHSAYLKAVKDYIQILMVQVVVLLPFFANVDQEKKNGIFIGIVYFIIYLLTSRASAMSAYFSVRNKTNIALLTLLIGFGFGAVSGAFYLAEIPVWALVAFAGVFVVENIRKPILTGFIAEEVPNTILASVISAQSLVQTIMTAVIALAFGFLSDEFSVGFAFIFVSISLALLSIVLRIFFRDRTKVE